MTKSSPPEAGKSSFELIDTGAFFAALPLSEVRTVLDLGCGVGRYLLPLARQVPASCRLTGFDLWGEGVHALNDTAAKLGLGNVEARVVDITEPIPMADTKTDLVLLATVVHDLAERGTAQATLSEAFRVLGPGGVLAVVEFKKQDSQPGPPLAIRLSPEELTRLVAAAGFGPAQVTDLGENCYLALYRKQERAT